EAGDVPGPVVVAEYVEHPAIDHGVDSEAEATEVECVRDLEPRGQAALGRFRAGPRNRGRRNVDAGDIGATTGCQQRVLAGAEASVEKAASQAALGGEPDNRRLRPADVPRGRRGGRVAGVPLWVRLLRHQSCLRRIVVTGPGRGKIAAQAAHA